MTKRKKSKDYWDDALDDPLFYVPLIGPALHGIRRALEVKEECDGDCESCEYYDEKTDGCLK